MVKGVCACEDKYKYDSAGEIQGNCEKARCPVEAVVTRTRDDGGVEYLDCYGNGDCDTVRGTCSCKGLFDPATNCKVSTCPNNCSGHGVCDTSSGNCSCNGIFGGTDCGEVNGLAMGGILAGFVTVVAILMSHVGMSFYQQYVKTSDNPEETTLMLGTVKGE